MSKADILLDGSTDKMATNLASSSKGSKTPFYSDSRGARWWNGIPCVQAMQFKASWAQATKLLRPSYNTRGWHLLKSEVDDWLHEIVGPPYYVIGPLDYEDFNNSDQMWCFHHDHVNDSGPEDIAYYTLYFKRPDHAMLFKLAWGGSI